MTTTTTEAKWFPTKYAIMGVALAAATVVIIAISQWFGSDGQQTVSAPEEVSFAISPQVAAPSAGTSGLVQALNSGKFDAGLVSTPAPTVAGSVAAPKTVVINGQGGLYDALFAGKYGADFAPGNLNVRYAQGPETLITVGGLKQALSAGKLDAGLNTTPSTSASVSAFIPDTIVINGQSGLHDALIAGKFNMDTAPRYVAGTEAGVSSGLVNALNSGKFNEGLTADTATVHPSPAATGTPTVSGGHQE